MASCENLDDEEYTTNPGRSAESDYIIQGIQGAASEKNR